MAWSSSVHDGSPRRNGRRRSQSLDVATSKRDTGSSERSSRRSRPRWRQRGCADSSVAFLSYAEERRSGGQAVGARRRERGFRSSPSFAQHSHEAAREQPATDRATRRQSMARGAHVEVSHLYNHRRSGQVAGRGAPLLAGQGGEDVGSRDGGAGVAGSAQCREERRAARRRGSR